MNYELWKVAVLAGLILMAAGCVVPDGEQVTPPNEAASPPAEKEVRVDTTIPWELLESGAHGRTAESGNLDDSRSPWIEVATSQSELETLWKRLVGERPIPSVTFDETVVVFLLLPPQRTAGYSIEPHEVRRTDGTLEIDATFHRPGEGDILAQVITAPYAVLKVETPSPPASAVWYDAGTELARWNKGS
jgi:hypothetical protein